MATTVTADDAFGQPGSYLFEGLIPGIRYFVQFVQPAAATGFTSQNAGGDDTVDSDAAPGNGATATVILAPDEVNRTLDAGLVTATGTLALGNQVWMESDNDGVFEPQDGEMGVDGVRLNLYRDANGDDNGTDVGALTASLPVTLTDNGEPTSEDGNNDTNLTVDFGFIPTAPGAVPEYDYGDAPDVVVGTAPGDYNTTALDTGAYHQVAVPNAPFLGACVDADGGFNQDTAAARTTPPASARSWAPASTGMTRTAWPSPGRSPRARRPPSP